MSQIHFCAKNTSFCPFKPMGVQTPKNPPYPNSRFLLGHVNPHLIHECLGRPLTMPNDSSIGSHTLHNYTTKSPLVTMGCPKFTPKTAPSPLTITTPSNTPIPRLTPITIPTTSESTHSLCHSTLSGQTDQPTDGLGDRLET